MNNTAPDPATLALFEHAGTPPEVQAERDRCVEWCERLARIFDDSAAKLRADGSFTTRSLWPPFKRVTVVHHNWEKIAVEKDNAANAVRALERAIKENWQL